jgi:peptidyl-prolyl cis-trans isomerase B (cyclophilin B)
LNKFLLIFSFSLILIPFGNYAFGQITNDPVVVIETNLGNIIIQFFPGDAPDHVNNFLSLSKTGFYDGTLFHRIIPGFMIQGGDPNTINGDPNTWGQGGPEGRTLNAEFNSIEHNRGIVSMARSQDPNSAGSQFFIVTSGFKLS